MEIADINTTKRKNVDTESAPELKKLKSEHSLDDNHAVINTITRSGKKLKKSVVLLCYQGKNYFGMQRNRGVQTVEEVLLQALLKANIITSDECENPKSIKFQRAARTDKGVSAVRQIVSLKVPLAYISESFPATVNEHLPPEIRILSIKRVTQSFDAKIACDARTYSYMLPTFALNAGDDAEAQEEYRITSERIEEMNKFLQCFVGTHNFYNFTSGRLPTDSSCKRYIMSCKCGQPFVKEGIEFVIIQVKGQSFMLHQIRKMVGIAIAVARNLVNQEQILEKVWKTDRIDIPMAPGLGLMLEEVHYNWYNKKYGGDGVHEALSWDNCQDVINKFREEQIYKNIAVTEKEEKSMIQWLLTLPHHTFDVRNQESNPPITCEVENKVEDE